MAIKNPERNKALGLDTLSPEYYQNYANMSESCIIKGDLNEKLATKVERKSFRIQLRIQY